MAPEAKDLSSMTQLLAKNKCKKFNKIEESSLDDLDFSHGNMGIDININKRGLAICDR